MPDLDDISVDDVNMLRKLQDMQVCEMEFHERTWQAMHKNLREIQDRLQVALDSSGRSRTTRQEKSPASISPRRSAHEHMSGTNEMLGKKKGRGS